MYNKLPNFSAQNTAPGNTLHLNNQPTWTFSLECTKDPSYVASRQPLFLINYYNLSSTKT
jgi:hypothetical protein